MSILREEALPTAPLRRFAGGAAAVLETGGRGLAWLPVAVVCAAVLVAVFGPLLDGLSPFDQHLIQRNRGPNGTFPLGTDHLGRDVLARLVYGTRQSLLAALGGVLVALLAGGLLGLLVSVARGPLETVYFGAVDLLRAMPGVLTALLLVTALGAGLGPVTLALGLTFAPIFAHVGRAAYRREAASEYVAAAHAYGAGPARILVAHVLPNIVGPMVTQAAIVLPRCIVTESVLSFLGLGLEPDAPTWGRMIAQAARYIERNPTAVLAPVIALALVTLSLTLLGDRLRRRLDPLRRGRR